MSAPKWTPGPWKARPPGESGGFTNWIVTCPRYDGYADEALLAVASTTIATYSEADAHLIAAAPDLHEACVDAVNELVFLLAEVSKFAPGTYSATGAIERARAALSKAEGQQ